MKMVLFCYCFWITINKRKVMGSADGRNDHVRKAKTTGTKKKQSAAA